MKKAAALLLATVSVLLILPFYARAEDNTERIAAETGADRLESSALSGDELSGKKTVNVFEKALSITFSAISENSGTIAAGAGVLLAAIIFCGIMAALGDGSEALGKAGGYISLLLLSAAAYSLIYEVFVFVNAGMQSLSLAITSLQPVMASLYAAGGNAAAGAASSSGFLLFLTVLEIICSKLLLPLLSVCFALALCGAIPGGIDISSVANAVKTTATAIMSFVFTILGFTLYIQTSVAATGDSYVSRSVRFASGAFVPVIGGILGDAYRTLAASAAVVKGTVGTAGVVMIFAAILPPAAVTLCARVVFSLSSAAAKALGREPEARFLSTVGGMTGILFALTLGAGAAALIAMAVFVSI